jgi:hypothetical protein
LPMSDHEADSMNVGLRLVVGGEGSAVESRSAPDGDEQRGATHDQLQ